MNADRNAIAADVIAPFYRNRGTAVDAITGTPALALMQLWVSFSTLWRTTTASARRRVLHSRSQIARKRLDRLEGRNADLKRQRDDATDDVIKNLNKNLSDLERTTSTLSGKTLTQAHG